MSFQSARFTQALQLTAGNTFQDKFAYSWCVEKRNDFFNRAYKTALTLWLAQRQIQRMIDEISARTSQIELRIAVI